MTRVLGYLAVASSALCLAQQQPPQPEPAAPVRLSHPGQQLRERARKAEKAGDQVNAYLLYAQAAGVDPADSTSWSKAVGLKPQALAAIEAAAAAAAAALPTPAASLSEEPAAAPPEPMAIPTLEDLVATRQMSAPLRLKPKPGRRSFDLKGDSKTVATEVLKAYGIEIVFDADLQPIANLRFHLDKEVDFAEAADALQLATGTFIVPVSRKMAMLAKDVPNKRQELEHTMAIAVPLPTTTTVQEAQELARAVQSLMEIQKFGVDPNQRLVVIRDRESKVLPALALFHDLVRHRAQVMVEVELLETSESTERTLGLQLPTRFPVAWLSSVWNSVRTFPAGATEFLTFGGGYSFFGFGLANSQLFATFSRGNSRTLSRATLRGVEGQPINFHLGDRYPVLSAGYFGDTGSAASDQVFRPPPTVNFEDLGIVLKITPRVHDERQVSLEIEAEYKVLTGQALNDIPVIANRAFKASARMGTNETVVIAGLMRNSEARSITGPAGLATLPVLGHLFSQRTNSKDEGQALLVIRTYLIDVSPGELATRTVYTGTDARPRIPI